MYLYEIYIDDGREYGGDFKLVSKTRYTKEEFKNIVTEAKSKCDINEYDYDTIDKLGKALVTYWELI